MTLAYGTKFSTSKQWIVGFLMTILLTSSIFWNPFATSWLSYRAYELHKNQKIAEAIKIYKEILDRDSDNEFAKVNLQQLEISQLQQKALELHQNQKYKEARQIYNQILILEPDQQWAKDNLKMLPN